MQLDGFHPRVPLDLPDYEFCEKLVGCAQGGGRMLHQVTMRTPWRGEAQMFTQVEDAPAFEARHRVKYDERMEKLLSPVEGETLKKGSSFLSKQTQWWESEIFRPSVPHDLPDEMREEIARFLRRVETARKWPSRPSTTFIFLIPKGVTSKRPVALLTTLRWSEWLRAPAVQERRGRASIRVGRMLDDFFEA